MQLLEEYRYGSQLNLSKEKSFWNFWKILLSLLPVWYTVPRRMTSLHIRHTSAWGCGQDILQLPFNAARCNHQTQPMPSQSKFLFDIWRVLRKAACRRGRPVVTHKPNRKTFLSAATASTTAFPYLYFRLESQRFTIVIFIREDFSHFFSSSDIFFKTFFYLSLFLLARQAAAT